VNQQNLFDPGSAMYPPRPPAAPYVKSSETSRQAGQQIARITGELGRRVLEAIRRAGPAGLIDEQIQRTTGIRESTARARRVELVQHGLVKDSGLTRPTASGRSATVWIARDFGQEEEF